MPGLIQTSTMTRRATAALMAVLVVLMSFSPVLADNTDSDGDGVAPYGDNSMAFGSVSCGVATDKTAPVWVTRLGAAGSTNVFKDGSTVTISVLSVTGAGLSAVMTGTTTILPIGGRKPPARRVRESRRP